MRILVVEDDEKVASYVRKGLTEHGHSVDVANDGREGLYLATSESYDVLVVDRMLPNVNGVALLTALRASDIRTPALILSAMSKVEDRVSGLRSGADDYLIKPFAFEELLARLEILCARASSTAERVTKLSAFDLELDLLSRQVTRGGETIDLQSREFRLLEYLLNNKGQVVTRTMLLEQVWDYNFDPQTNVIDVHISRLRQKIDKHFDKTIIQTVRGAGYIVPADS